MRLSKLISLTVIMTVCLKCAKGINDRPIIAVLAGLYPHNGTSSYIAASYVKYLESAGARVVHIPHYASANEIEEIFSYVNGVLFPGGGAKWFRSHYHQNAKIFWDLAIEANNKDDYFPIWGTCLGFEAMHLLRSDTPDILSRTKSMDVSYPLEYTSAASRSRLFSGMSEELFLALGSEKITFNVHVKGITRETYNSFPELRNFFRILSTNIDSNGKEFVSTVEAFEYPFYGTQWHPERSNFEFTEKYQNIPHSANAVKTSQYMANFFVNEARKSIHRFPSLKAEQEFLIYNNQPIYAAVKCADDNHMSYYEQIYVFGAHTQRCPVVEKETGYGIDGIEEQYF